MTAGWPMTKKPFLFLRVTHWVLLVSAYLIGIVIQGILGGLVVLIIGGNPVPVLPFDPNSPTIPARVAGALNLFVQAPLTFIVIHGFASAIRALLEVHERVTKGSEAGRAAG